MKLHNIDSALEVQVGDTVKVDPEWNYTLSGHSPARMDSEVEVLAVFPAENYQSSVAFQVMSKKGKKYILDAGWFYQGSEDNGTT